MIAKTPEEKLALKKAKSEYKKHRKKEILLNGSWIKKEEPILTGLLEKEHPLADDYPVYWNYRYVVAKNGVFNVVMSDIQGTVKELRRDLSKKYGFNVGEIFSCDLKSRNLL